MAMAVKDKITRKFIEITVRRAIKDIRDNPARGIRNLVEKGQELGNGKFQPEFLQMVHDLLESSDSPYFELTSRTAKQVNQDTLEDFGINMGQNGFTNGVKVIREIEEKYRYNIPWIIGLSYGAGAALSPDNIGGAVSDGKKLGIFSYALIHTSGDVCSILPVITKHDDCAFILYASGEALSDSAVDRLSRIHNLMVAVSTDTPAYVRACQKLRDARMMYSVCGFYGDDNIDAVLSDKWLEDVMQAEPMFSFLAPRADADDYMRNKVSEYVKERRTQPKFATIPIDIPSDALFIDGVVSEGDCSAMFDSEGQLYGYARRYAGAEFNLMRNTLRSIFITAFPK